ncbi:DUF421 domain-containing protein [Bacillus sp. DTU_2020_1000418_1_SI_GHA_SEK_038]|uniref:DUF421 domain-containing protein n=1 Tax=Bacillus sp. DTU_2020_1000418_1_SI_GHA_SEK_038 TaxID=3077585 RepID=UPI0028E21D32|nr:DUF421 domain-containing protein [Bacillus sp. DTU_2020_1000418_1_SI_GHA_SEK_038]WNS74428.1 DUF421 domain-containing protein [Bacillus sp. DTU_2020_1000418_1_SI_GHA_SEK_038]
MLDYSMIILRTIFLYALILAVFRIMGKKELGQLSMIDFVVTIMLAEMAVLAIENPSSPLLPNVLPMLVLMCIQITLGFLTLKSKKFRDLVDGKPTIIINKGKIDEEAMKKHRYNFDDLLLQLRGKDIRNITDVEFAVLETTGELSVLKKEKKKTGNLTVPLILDGIIQESSLESINQTNFWLRQQLRKRGYTEIQKISFCSYENGQFYIDLKDEKK